MKQSKALSGLALAKRAGKLVMGFDAVMDSAKRGETKLVALSTELSPKTQKEAAYYCERYGTALIRITLPLEDAKSVLGKRSGVFGITDEGFRRLLQAAEASAGIQE